MKVIQIPMNKIVANSEFNCRGAIAPIDVVDLAKDIAKNGLLEPLIVQPIANEKYQLIAGYRRHTALTINKWQNAPCSVVEGLSELEAKSLNLRENLIRKNLNIKQEADALKVYLKYHLTSKDIAMDLGQPKPWVDIRLQLLTLPEDIQREAAVGLINQEQIKYVASLPPSQQHSAVKEIKEKKIKGEKFQPPLKEKKKVDYLAKKPMKKEEVFDVINYLLTHGGSNIVTRALALTTGSISLLDFYREYKEYMAEEGYNFPIPEEAKLALTK
jgi:ParB family transcriptional regulator, chromosome partitioning protein